MRSRPLRASNLLPDSPWRRYAIRIVESNQFSWVMACVLVANAGLLASQHWLQADQLTQTVFYTNIIFTLAFVVECGLGIMGRGPRLYWRLSWNRFDVFVTVASVIDVIIASFFESASSLSVFVSVLRVLRVLRLVRLARWWVCSSPPMLFESVAFSPLFLAGSPALNCSLGHFTLPCRRLQASEACSCSRYSAMLS